MSEMMKTNNLEDPKNIQIKQIPASKISLGIIEIKVSD